MYVRKMSLDSVSVWLRHALTAANERWNENACTRARACVTSGEKSDGDVVFEEEMRCAELRSAGCRLALAGPAVGEVTCQYGINEEAYVRLPLTSRHA